MYILKNKAQLSSFISSIREQSKDSFSFSPKSAKFKELVSRCLGFNSYADMIANLPIDMETFKSTFPNELTKILMAEPYGKKVDVNKIKTIYNNAMTLDDLSVDMNFSEEINQIKNDRDNRIMDEETQLRQHTKDEFIAWVQQTIDDLENVKECIKNDVVQGENFSVVMPKVLKLDPLSYDGASLRVTAGTSPDTPIMRGRILRRKYDYQYECINSSLLPSKFDRRGLNGRLHYVDETVGKRVILDGKLIELWELLESMELKPFFYTYYNLVDLRVRL